MDPQRNDDWSYTLSQLICSVVIAYYWQECDAIDISSLEIITFIWRLKLFEYELFARPEDEFLSVLEYQTIYKLIPAYFLSIIQSIVLMFQGFCCYLEQSFGNLKERGVVIGYDARAHPTSGGSSKRFASLAAAVFISRGVPVHLFSEITPTPFVVRS